ncbi:hypothetical protein [Streptomyces sp. NPDC051554]|uniref:hypothetical protein n=1 Tax=Streptomyces sp. NPDC051554 TaxID=3365656 RepID=UPI0037A8768D
MTSTQGWGLNEQEAVKASLESLREGDGLTPDALNAPEHKELRRLLGTGDDTTAGVEVLAELARKVEGKPKGRPGIAIRNALAIDTARLKNVGARRENLASKIGFSKTTVFRAERVAISQLLKLIFEHASNLHPEQPGTPVSLSKETEPLPSGEDEDSTSSTEYARSGRGFWEREVVDSIRHSPILSIVAAALLGAVVALAVSDVVEANDHSAVSVSESGQLDPKKDNFAISDLAKPLVSVSVAKASQTYTSGWGPNRPTFTDEKPAPYAVLNSITNNPFHGDERNFTQCRDKESGAWATAFQVADGHIYQCYMWFENAVAPNLAKDNRAAWLQNTRARVSFSPSSSPKGVSLVGILSAANSPTVWSSCFFSSNAKITLTYVKGTAGIQRVPYYDTFRLVSDTIATPSGIKLGGEKFDGIVRQGVGYVLFDVKAKLG